MGSELVIIIFNRAGTLSSSILFAKYNQLTTLTHQGPRKLSVSVINLSFDVLSGIFIAKYERSI